MVSKTSQVGELNCGKFKTQIFATEKVKTSFKTKKASLATLIPTAWAWYDSELLEAIDENGDGKADEKFGKEFILTYFLENENISKFEQSALIMSKSTIKGIRLKYVCLKTN